MNRDQKSFLKSAGGLVLMWLAGGWGINVFLLDFNFLIVAFWLMVAMALIVSGLIGLIRLRHFDNR